ncbi:hypothetical protein ACMD2_00819 [Ananas comosus]|uniref:Uncharacterized protein n=1 Tax=Ananas comosus TaxID=4615 RepID=A0A199UM75_ANACO|nr:hypothetical protein ACMD2_00819 [Ananas comosus]
MLEAVKPSYHQYSVCLSEADMLADAPRLPCWPSAPAPKDVPKTSKAPVTAKHFRKINCHCEEHRLYMVIAKNMGYTWRL